MPTLTPLRIELDEPAPCLCHCPCDGSFTILYDDTSYVTFSGEALYERSEPLYVCPPCYHGNHKEGVN